MKFDFVNILAGIGIAFYTWVMLTAVLLMPQTKPLDYADYAGAAKAAAAAILAAILLLSTVFGIALLFGWTTL